MEVPVPKPSSFWNSLSFKLITVGILILLMLIPGAMIRNLIREREQTQLTVVSEIGSKWGYGQTLNGPVLSLPYYIYIKDDEKTYKQLKYAHFLPENLSIHVQIQPEIRYRGIYQSVVYSSVLKVSGNFSVPDHKKLNLEDENVLFEDAFLEVGIPDMRGIQEELSIQWNHSTVEVEPGIPTMDLSESGFHGKVPLQEAENYQFSFDIVLDGSDFLYFTPIGKITDVSISSPWQHPKFDGAFLPDNREVDEDGFTASWRVLHLNRNFPQAWTGNKHITGESAFGVNLLLPVDQYQKTERSAKYAIMFIALTFMIFFFVEVLNRQRIHPVQYLLVGLSISIFYVLLLSLSEQIGFNLAYGLSSLGVIGLITSYSVSIFRNPRLTLILGICLVILYIFLYTLIQLQDYALLMGSVGLFLVMGLIMYASRNVDWYNATHQKDKGRSVGF